MSNRFFADIVPRPALAIQIQRKRDHIAEFKLLIAECWTDIQQMRSQFAQVEAAMQLHELQGDPKDLGPIRPHENKAVLRAHQESAHSSAQSCVLTRCAAASPANSGRNLHDPRAVRPDCGKTVELRRVAKMAKLLTSQLQQLLVAGGNHKLLAAFRRALQAGY